jgi:hypothetical protein
VAGSLLALSLLFSGVGVRQNTGLVTGVRNIQEDPPDTLVEDRDKVSVRIYKQR